jgi:hypothetical protein
MSVPDGLLFSGLDKKRLGTYGFCDPLRFYEALKRTPILASLLRKVNPLPTKTT